MPIHIRFLEKEDAAECVKLEKRNRDFFENFSMAREDDFYTLEGQTKRIEKDQENIKNDREYYFGIFNEDGLLIGNVSLFQVMRGSLQGAFIGYFMDKQENGKGYTTEAVRLIVEYAFEKLKLHRIEAGVMPHNLASIRVLKKAGFHKEGIARKNVKINGKWEDHQVLALINPAD